MTEMGALPTSMAIGSATRSVKSCESVCTGEDVSVTVTVMSALPAGPAGVPLIVPVAASSVRPAGSVPETANVFWPVPPVATIVSP